MSNFQWALIDESGTTTGTIDQAFESREDAETWIGVHWADLLAGGAKEVALHEDDAELYRMGLEPQ